jgi:hypothetical protein
MMFQTDCQMRGVGGGGEVEVLLRVMIVSAVRDELNRGPSHVGVWKWAQGQDATYSRSD